MPLDNGKIMVPWTLAEELLALGLAAPTLRLAFSMLHQLDLAGIGGNTDVGSPIWATCADLRDRVGPKGSKGAREVRAAAAALHAAGIIDACEMLDKASVLQWRFVDRVRESMQERQGRDYVLVDLHELGRFRSLHRIGLYLKARKVRDSKAPEFTVPLDDGISEEANVRRLLPALCLVAEVVEVVCHVGLERRRERPETERFRIRMTHPGTSWYYHGYIKFHRPKAIWRVDGEGWRRFDPSSVRDQRRDLIEKDELGLEQQVWTPQ